MRDVTGKVAIVTGASSGMGLETARLLAERGARVALVGRRREPLDELRHRIEHDGGTADVIIEDVAAEGAPARIVAQTERTLGAVDILVNNAGSSSPVQNPVWITDAQWRGVLDVNLNAVFALTQQVLPGMLAREAGTIITVSSLAAVNPNLLGGAAYGAAKAGVRNFMTFLHNTFRGQGLRAITVLPGEADTPILDSRARPPRPDERANMVQPIDVAEVVLLAASMPQRTVLQEVIVAPTRQRDTTEDLEVARHLGAPGDDSGKEGQ